MAPLSKALSSSNPAAILHHFSHPHHPLHLLNHGTEFLCNGCNALGFGSRYQCLTCGFHLHEHCATCATALSSPIHPHHQLNLVNLPVNDRFCDVCGDLVHGLFYTCRAHGCEFDVHPLCTQLPVHARIALHPAHVLQLLAGTPAGCARCGKTCMFSRYKCELCNFNIHLECALGDSDVTCRSVVPAAGAPVVGIAGGGYGMMSNAVAYGTQYTMMNQPYYNSYNHQVQENKPGKVQGGQPSGNGGGKRRKIYSMVGRLAASAVVFSVTGIPIKF